MWVYAIFGALLGNDFFSLWRQSASSIWTLGPKDSDRFLSDAGAVFELEHYLFHLSPFMLVAIAIWHASRKGFWLWPAFTIIAVAIGGAVPWYLRADGFGQLFFVIVGFAMDFYGWFRALKVHGRPDQSPA
jgi:hypothetical protein